MALINFETDIAPLFCRFDLVFRAVRAVMFKSVTNLFAKPVYEQIAVFVRFFRVQPATKGLGFLFNGVIVLAADQRCVVE